MDSRSDPARDVDSFATNQAPPIGPALASSPASPSRIVSFIPATDPNRVSHPVSSLSLPPPPSAAAAAAHPYSSHPYANPAVNPMTRYQAHMQPDQARHDARSEADNDAFHTYSSSYMRQQQQQQQHSSSIYKQAPLPLPDVRSHPESHKQPVNAQYPTQTPTPVFSPHFDHLDKAAARHQPASQAASRSDLQQRQRLEPHSTASPLPPPPPLHRHPHPHPHPDWSSINRYSTLQPSSVASSPTCPPHHLPHSHATQAAPGQGYPSQPQQLPPPRQGLAIPNLSTSPGIAHAHAHAHPAGIRLPSIHSSGPVRSPTVLSSPMSKRPEPYTPAQSYKPLPDGPRSPKLLPFGPACDTYNNTKPTAATSAPAAATASTSTPLSSTSPTERLKQEGIKIADILSPESAPGPLVAAAKPTKRTKKSTPTTTKGRPSKRNTAMETPPTNDDSNVEYRIFLRQQPIAARSCGFGERDRRTIDPPPILQMTMTTTPPLKPGELAQRIQGRAIVVHCSVWNEAGDADCSAMPAEYRCQRRLMGTLVASPFVGKDENGEEGCFFCFPDLSCRTPGSFRLRFVMVIIDPRNSQHERSFPIRSHAMSTPFTVYNAKDFPGMRASTPLTHCLREQGCLISIKKGNTRTGGDQDAQEDHNTDGDGEAKPSDSKPTADAEDCSQTK